MRTGIVITCYGQAQYLIDSLRSVVQQSVDNWEAVVLDDASPDYPAIRQAVDAIGDRRIRLVHWEINRGVAAARNAGVRELGSEAFVCLDGDDRLHPRYLERLMPTLQSREDVDCRFPDLMRFGLRSDLLPMKVPIGHAFLRVCPPGAGTLMRRRLWERIGGYDEADALRSGMEDKEFFIRAFAAGCRAVHVGEPLYFYRILPESRSTLAYAENHIARLYIYRKHRAIFDAAGEGRRFVATGFDRAARKANEKGDRSRQFSLSLRAFLLCPSASRMRGLAQSVLPKSVRTHSILRRRDEQEVV
jgi:glycosyltransferase involved in cell wall biosynthesis